MGKSLIDAIGRKKAFALMENAVLRAIEENQALGLGRGGKGKKLRMVDGVLCVVGAGRSVPLVAGQSAPAQASSLKKSVPIA
ncbi:TPA: hypothetical protein ACKPYT_006249 [Pseudomonas aeruginosa]|uniref:hypothetical protein n=1 Tax=Pseudomonas aeruginosa TaxID=287 RepID=UPI0021F12F4D|nr:hypothetical protein [Pseudomonas aeruginosa]MCV4039534.1 hypothetical protein [Pseudomonas aeruginosa]HBO7954395.1 hypothetical protein [Pseudomonas aeruginosa]HBO7974662.1 hypothetical protein [Pseudomonas aeruginosa]HBO8747238.1 hypothetical protein [Pseudomonas aeruginosa]